MEYPVKIIRDKSFQLPLDLDRLDEFRNHPSKEHLCNGFLRVTDDLRIPFHKTVLASASSAFMDVLTLKSNIGRREFDPPLPDLEPEKWAELIDYVYTGDLVVPDIESCLAWLDVAVALGMGDLKRALFKAVSITEDSVVSTWKATTRGSNETCSEKIRGKCVKFILENFFKTGSHDAYKFRA